MLDTRLILVDGIPGSGKSTTAQWIALELQDLGLSTLTIENSAREWPAYRKWILQFLSLSPLAEEPISRDYLASFEGRYRDLSGAHPRNPECTIRMDSGGLVIYDFRYPRSNLIPKAPGEFYVETLGYELAFEVDGQGQVSKMKVGGKEPGVGIGALTLLGREFHRTGDTYKPPTVSTRLALRAFGTGRVWSHRFGWAGDSVLNRASGGGSC